MTTKGKKNSEYHVPNLERALKILELLSKRSEGMSISDIASKLSYPRNSVFRIVSTLNNYGYLERDDEFKTFCLSMKLLTVGIHALSEPKLVENSLKAMNRLRDEYKETVALGILRGDVGMVIEEVQGTHLFRFVLEPGRKFNLHTSAPAKAILAYLSDKERDELIDRIEFKIFNERTISSKKKYLIKLKEIKRKGYSVDMAEEIEGMHCVGAPIFNRHGQPFAAIWITGPSIRVLPKAFPGIGANVRRHADSISKSLGYQAK
jgi:DNA-binding IclR family transcriptional regulator